MRYTKILQKWRAKEAEEAKFISQPQRSTSAACLPTVQKSKSGWILPSGNGLDTDSDVLMRVRKRLNAARNLHGFTWEHLFVLGDTDKSGTLSWKEFKQLTRQTLGVPEQAICDGDLRILFSHVNKGSGSLVDLAHLLEFLARGQQDASVVAARAQQRIARVRRNIQLAFVQLKASESDVRKLFEVIDLDNSNRLSEYEFESFVRGDLQLSHWDVMTSDLREFYAFLDRDGDGIDVDEFLDYVTKVNRTKSSMGAQSFAATAPADGEGFSKGRRKRRTYKEEVEEDLRQKGSLPDGVELTMPFVATGRSRRPTSRAAATAANLCDAWPEVGQMVGSS